MPRLRGDQGGEGAHHGAQLALAAVGDDDAGEILHQFAEALGGQDGAHRALGGVDIDQRAVEQPAQIGAGVDHPAERVHLLDGGVERVLVFGEGIECGGVAFGQPAAGCDCRAARGHGPVPCCWRPVRGRGQTLRRAGSRPAARRLAWA